MADMARLRTPQGYPRADGLLDDMKLVGHQRQLTEAQLRRVILTAIGKASKKSRREILELPPEATEEVVKEIYRKSGRSLYGYFLKYYGDPAATAYQCYGRHYSEVAREQFRNRTLQQERMNSGWRYQFIAKDAASLTGRFSSISDIGTNEADFNVTVGLKKTDAHVTIYVSVKNRTNTMGGQDWPKAIFAMEDVAMNDRNRTGPYLCVFGMAMEKGGRLVKRNKSGTPHSPNTEIWKSDFFWPFFTSRTYVDIVTSVLETLMALDSATQGGCADTDRAADQGILSAAEIEPQGTPIEDIEKALEEEDIIPEELIRSFGDCCEEAGLLDAHGKFCDPLKLAKLFCGVR